MARLVLERSFVRDDLYRVGSVWEGWPCEGVITQVFAQPSVSGSTHAGVDIAPAYRTPTYFPLSGFARRQTWGTFGNWYTVECEPDDEYGQLYYVLAHLDSFALDEDRWVEAGELAGYTGFTGLVVPPGVAGSHLHFGFSYDKFISGDYRRCVDPYIFVLRQEEEAVIPEYIKGLMEVALGDPNRMSTVYDRLDNFRGTGVSGTNYPAGFFYEVNQSDGTADPIDGDEGDLNDSIVRMKRIQYLAWGDTVRGQDAWAVIK